MTKQVKTVKRPARLDIVDMPRDKTRALGGLRQALCASFNYCRKYPAKMAVLKEVLKYTYNRIVAWEKEHEAQQEQIAKLRLEEEGESIGIELDSRKSIENMTKDLNKFKEDLILLAEEAAIEAKENAQKDAESKANQSDDSEPNGSETDSGEPESSYTNQ